jgi:toxin ParE1/3/4
MNRPVAKWPRVERDLAEHYAFIAQDKAEPAERLLIVAEESFERLARHPEIGLAWKSARPHLRDIRHYPMPAPFRSYIIFYRIRETRLEIVAVLHGARDLEKVLSEIVD